MMATWVGPPRSYTPGRPRPIQYVVIHDTEGGEGPTSAEDGAAYDKVRTDGTSTHLFVDSNSAVREVWDQDQAHAARQHGNAIGIQVELCGHASQTGAQWHDANSWPELQIAAREVAALCKAHNLAVRRLSVAEVRAAYYAPAGQRPTGICGHVDVTAAYPEDLGSHTDPGPNFPWAEFLAMVVREMAPTAPTTKGADMPGLFQVTGITTLYLSDGFKRKTLTGTMWEQAKATWGNMPISKVASLAELTNIAGPDWTESGPPVSITVAQLDEVSAAAKEGAAEGIDGTILHKPS